MRLRPARRGTRRLGVAVGVAGLFALGVPAVPGAPAQDAGVPSYTFVSASSGADGVRVYFDVVGFLPVTPALSLGSVTAEGFVESSRRTAVALLPDPGGTVVSAPGLIAGLVGVPNVPGYPLVARADDPFIPTADASPLLGAGVGVIRAEASADRAAAQARLAGAGSGDDLTGLAPINELIGALADGAGLPLDGALLDLGSVEAEVEEVQEGPSTLRATATSRLSGISLLGGLVRIASIEVTASAALDGATATAEPPEVDVGGVTVAGIPVRITEDGLSLAGSATPLGDLLAPLADPLLQQGLAVRLAPTEAQVEGTTARARGGGVTIELTAAYQGYPVVLRVTLGDVRAAVQGSGDRITPSTPSVSPAVPLLPSTGSPPAVELPDLTVAPVVPGGPAPSGEASPSLQPVVALLDLRRLYPFLVALAAVLAGSRLAAAARLRRPPGARPEMEELFRW